MRACVHACVRACVRACNSGFTCVVIGGIKSSHLCHFLEGQCFLVADDLNLGLLSAKSILFLVVLMRWEENPR